jgi:hypothetical protein
LSGAVKSFFATIGFRDWAPGRSLLTLIALAATACSPVARLQVDLGEWELLPPGSPPQTSPGRPSLGRWLRQGQGTEVALGDLVELRFAEIGSPAASADDERRGWLWIGFDGPTQGDFPVADNGFAAALIGLRQGSQLTFVASPKATSPDVAGSSRVLPFGDWQRYIALAPLAREQRSGYARSDGGPGHDGTLVEIVRVCRGQAEQRLITLLDQSTVRIGQDLGRGRETNEPRWLYLREARWEGECQDGRHASFRYPPIAVEPPAGRTNGLKLSHLWGPWTQAAWRQVPIGVVLQ